MTQQQVWDAWKPEGISLRLHPKRHAAYRLDSPIVKVQRLDWKSGRLCIYDRTHELINCKDIKDYAPYYYKASDFIKVESGN